ncbi:hypothetical protein GCM10027589_06020 [Actinocorallia lasiicapitis]
MRTFLAFALVVTLAGCGAPASPPAPVPSSAADDLDVPRPAAIEFFSRYRVGSAVEEADLHTTITNAVKDSTAVVIAEIAGPGPSRSITGEVASDVIPLSSYRLTIVEVLHGELPTPHQKELIIEFMGKGRGPYPQGKAIWFLHRKGTATRHLKNPPPPDPAERDRYRVLSSQGLFLQGPDSVIAPLAEQPQADAENQAKSSTPADAAAEGETSPKLSDLAAKIKKIA